MHLLKWFCFPQPTTVVNCTDEVHLKFTLHIWIILLISCESFYIVWNSCLQWFCIDYFSLGSWNTLSSHHTFHKICMTVSCQGCANLIMWLIKWSFSIHTMWFVHMVCMWYIWQASSLKHPSEFPVEQFCPLFHFIMGCIAHLWLYNLCGRLSLLGICSCSLTFQMYWHS